MAKNKVEKRGDFSPTQLAETLQKNKTGFKLPKGVSGANAATDYEKSRNPDFYQSIKVGDKTIDEKFKAATPTNQAHVDTVKKEIQTAMELTPATKAAIAKFEKDMKALDQLCKNNPKGVGPYFITDKIAAYKSEFMTAMQAQQKHELEELDKIFSDTSNPHDLAQQALKDQKIKDAFGVTTPAEVQAIKQQFTDALKKDHGNPNDPKDKTQMKAFLDPVNKEQIKVFDHIEKSLAEYNYKDIMLKYQDPTNSKLVGAFKRSGLFRQDRRSPFEPQAPGAMQEEMKKKMVENHQKAGEDTQMQHGVKPKKGKGGELRDIDLNDIENLQTTTGRKITKITKEKDNQYHIEVPSLSSWDWWSPHNKTDVTKDIRSLAERVKAEGHDSIKFTLEHKDEDTAKELAGIAYAEAIKAGFDPAKITVAISVNGKEQLLKSSDLEKLVAPEVLKEATDTLKLTKEVYQNVRMEHAGTEETAAGDEALKTIQDEANKPGGTSFQA